MGAVQIVFQKKKASWSIKTELSRYAVRTSFLVKKKKTPYRPKTYTPFTKLVIHIENFSEIPLAGRKKLFLQLWRILTKDPSILYAVQEYRILTFFFYSLFNVDLQYLQYQKLSNSNSNTLLF